MIEAISSLSRDKDFGYINPHTPGRIRVDDVMLPSGPVYIRRWNPAKGRTDKGHQRNNIDRTRPQAFDMVT